VMKGMLTTEARRTQVLPESPASIIMRRTKYAYMKAASLLYASRAVVPQYVLIRFVPQSPK
jgi:hypothetical protein